MQNHNRRKYFTMELETQMELNAFEKGIVRLESNDVQTFDKASCIADSLASGLPTREEIIASGLHSQETYLWT